MRTINLSKEEFLKLNKKCEICGKLLTYHQVKRSGIYCSNSCRKLALKNKYSQYQINKEKKYNQKPKLCKLCNKPLTYSQYKEKNDFCSHDCANKFIAQNYHRSEESRDNIKNIMKNHCEVHKDSWAKTHKGFYKNIFQSQNAKEKYNKKPKICPICGCIIPYEKRNHKTCSWVCSDILRSNRMKGREYSGNIKSRKFKSGYWHDIWCDSSWELAVLIYFADKGYNVKRCEDTFSYEMDGKLHTYYPDFILNDNIIIEVKGRENRAVSIKERVMINNKKKYHILRKNIVKLIIRRLHKKYKFKNIHELYDKEKV